MINRLFIISENASSFSFNHQVEKNTFFSLLVNSENKEEFQLAYNWMEKSSYPDLSITLNINKPITEEGIRFLTSFLFLPNYVAVKNQRVILLTSQSIELLNDSSEKLSTYLKLQEINDFVIHQLADITQVNNSPFLDATNHLLRMSPEQLDDLYKTLLGSDKYFNNDIFFHVADFQVLQHCTKLLFQSENIFKKEHPLLHSLAIQNMHFEMELRFLKHKILNTESELYHQKQFIDVLKSGHQAKEIQMYYNNEYEILPLWFKRLGHAIKVITGKRTIQSLFTKRTKKYNQ
jgi:phenolic acid decarboxylase